MDPLGAAYRDVQKAQSFLTDATVRDYHRKGITEMRDSNARFAVEIDAAAKRLAENGHSDPLGEALAQAAKRDGQMVGVSRLNYERGTRRRAKIGK